MDEKIRAELELVKARAWRSTEEGLAILAQAILELEQRIAALETAVAGTGCICPVTDGYGSVEVQPNCPFHNPGTTQVAYAQTCSCGTANPNCPIHGTMAVDSSAAPPSWNKPQETTASSPPATESPTKASPSDAEWLSVLEQRVTALEIFVGRMASITQPTPASSQSGQPVTLSGPAERGSGCAHVPKANLVNRWWDRCRKCDVWMWFELTPAPVAALTTSTSVKPESPSSVATPATASPDSASRPSTRDEG